MKKNLIALVLAGVAMLAGTSKTNAQMVSNDNTSEYHQYPIGDQNYIKPKAIRDFARTYGNVTNQKWTQVEDGFRVKFNSDGIRNIILYDKKGNWSGSIKYYGEEKLLLGIRHIVKSVYYDYKIAYTQEVETVESAGIPTYVVCLEDKTTIKLVRIFDGEMNVWKEYTKTN